MKKCKLAIVGATGLVGQKVIKVLWEEGLLEQLDLFLIASEKNAGRRYFLKVKSITLCHYLISV